MMMHRTVSVQMGTDEEPISHMWVELRGFNLVTIIQAKPHYLLHIHTVADSFRFLNSKADEDKIARNSFEPPVRSSDLQTAKVESQVVLDTGPISGTPKP